MPTELFTQLLVFLTALLGFGRYIVGVWYKMKEKDKVLEHKLMMRTIDRLDVSIKEIKGEVSIFKSDMRQYRTELASIVKIQAHRQQSFDSFIDKMGKFVDSANQRFEKLENFGKVQVKE